MGKHKSRNVSERVMKIIDDDELCSSFNWGSLCYQKLLKSLKSCLKPKQNTSDNENEKETEKEKDKEKDSYTILRFPFAFCVWIMEVFPVFQEKPFVNSRECGFLRMLCYSDMKTPHYDSLCKSTSIMKKCFSCSRWYHLFLLKKMRSLLVCMCNYLKIKVQCLQHNLMKACLKKLLIYSEKLKKDLQAESVRIYQKINLSEKRIQKDIKALKKNQESKVDTLLKLLEKPHEKNIEREPSVPISKDAVDDQCDDTYGHLEDRYESFYTDVHLEDETGMGTGIGKESSKATRKEDRAQSQDRYAEGTYDISTPSVLKEIEEDRVDDIGTLIDDWILTSETW